MTQQFSKLNKLSTPFKQNSSKQPKFSIGLKLKHDSSSESEEEYENSIFQPNTSVESGSLQYATDSSSSNDKSVEEGIELTENSCLTESKVTDKNAVDAFLPSVGIVMGSKTDVTDSVQGTLERKENMLSFDDSSQVDNVQLSSIMQNVSIKNPEIQISVEDAKLQPPGVLKADHKLSHSTGEVDIKESDDTNAQGDAIRLEKRSNSQYDVSLNISQSQSESALKNKFANLTSPVASVTKDLVLSPFSKIAKGMQNLGANLDPRKLSIGGVRQVTEKELEEHRKMHEKWKDCKTRLIAL